MTPEKSSEETCSYCRRRKPRPDDSYCGQCNDMFGGRQRDQTFYERQEALDDLKVAIDEMEPGSPAERAFQAVRKIIEG